MIIICDYCQKYVCPSSCPNFEGYEVGLGYSQKRCSLCEGRIYDEEQYYSYEGKTVCQECAQELISQELLALLECKNIQEFFDLLP